MATDPQKVRTALRVVETQLQGSIEPIESHLQARAQTINHMDEALNNVGALLNRQYMELKLACQDCVAQRSSDRNVDCSSLFRALEKQERILGNFERIRQSYRQAVRQYQNSAHGARRVIQQDIPAACHWLRERDDALAKFDGGLSTGSKTEASGMSRDTKQLLTLGQAAVATRDPHLLGTFLAALDRMGNHGSIYQRNRQQFLRNLVNDPTQPRYVHGWVRQELNRIEMVKSAKVQGRRSPGGNSRRIRGIPGLDVGHRFPGLDLVENFRLELASMNRGRYWIAKRLGIEKKFR